MPEGNAPARFCQAAEPGQLHCGKQVYTNGWILTLHRRELNDLSLVLYLCPYHLAKVEDHANGPR